MFSLTPKKLSCYTVGGQVSTAGQELIANTIHATLSECGGSMLPESGLVPVLLDSLDWRVRLPEAPSFSRRVSKQLYTTHKVKLPPKILQRIGNLAEEYSSGKHRVHWDVVSYIDWDAGDFGDNGSCYWTCREEDRLLLDVCGLSGAVRTFENGGEWASGTGRCWFVNQPDGVVLFNAYGDDLTLFAEIVADHLNGNYRKIALDWNGRADSIYINGDKGILVYPRGMRAPSEIDLHGLLDEICPTCGAEWDTDQWYSYEKLKLCKRCSCNCSKCGVRIPHKDDQHDGTWYLGAFRDPYGNLLCRTCAEARGFYEDTLDQEHAEREAADVPETVSAY
jgi:hypothetical protein